MTHKHATDYGLDLVPTYLIEMWLHTPPRYLYEALYKFKDDIFPNYSVGEIYDILLEELDYRKTNELQELPNWQDYSLKVADKVQDNKHAYADWQKSKEEKYKNDY